MSENIEIVIKIPANSPLAKELISILGKGTVSSTTIKSEATGKKELSQADQKKLQELKALLEIAKARGQTDLVRETEMQIKQLEG